MIATEKESASFLSLTDSPLPLPKKIVMCPPDFFDVLTVKNPHMEGNIGKIHTKRARSQWEEVKNAFLQLEIEVSILPPAFGLDDMVFTANQGLPFIDAQGIKKMLISRMYAYNRQDEIAPFAEFSKKIGYEVVDIWNEEDYFEGNGDGLWHRGKKILLGGYGFRTKLDSLKKISTALNTPIAAFELTDPRYYHLDTCLSILDEESALFTPDAFNEKGLEFLQILFPRLLAVDGSEAATRLAVNAFCPDNKHVIIDSGCPKTTLMLKQNGFIPVEVDTSEFVKSGGSVFCMRLAYW